MDLKTFKEFKDVMRKDVQYRRCFLIQIVPEGDVPLSSSEVFGIDDIEKKLFSLLPDKGVLECVVPVCSGVYFISLKSSTARDTFILDNWNQTTLSKLVKYDIETEKESDGECKKEKEGDDDIKKEVTAISPATKDIFDSSVGKGDDNVQVYKMVKFNCNIIPGYPLFSIKFSPIFEGKGNEAKIDSFIKRVTASNDGSYTIIRQKTLAGTLTGTLLVNFQNEDTKNHALRTLGQLKVTYNGNEVKYEEFKYEN